jgi:bifunctional N-acetylglucosamine-1-phosphate-uridyltransferase/glucosamine-1-phosphate-acetyltransferase GlmU-like protein
MKKPTLLILAAGLGSRYGSLKQIDQFGPSGETIIDYSIYDAIQVGFGKIVFVIRENIEEEFKEVFYGKFSDKVEIDYALQELDKVPPGIAVPPDRVKPWGTGHAVMVAADKISTPFAVINADDFYGRKSFEIVYRQLMQFKNEKPECCIVGYKLKNTLSEFGHVSRGVCEVDEAGNLSKIVERTHIYHNNGSTYYVGNDGEKNSMTAEEVVSMNLMGFSTPAFDYFKHQFKLFIKGDLGDLKKEFYLPEVVSSMLHAKDKVPVKVLETPEQWFGVTYKEDKPIASKRLLELVEQGQYPYRLWPEGGKSEIQG